jgi:putative copper resistance protein D
VIFSQILAPLPALFPLHGDEGPAAVAQPNLLDWWPLEPLPALAVLVGGLWYLLAVQQMSKRGDKWPVNRTFFFLLGLLTIFIATQGPLAALDTVLLTTHMVQHMILSMLAPVFLALGAPITLALRTFGPKLRKLLLQVLNSWYVKVISFPMFAGLIYILNPWILYFTSYYENTLQNTLLHNFNHLHFVVVGSIWIWALIGIDPMPRLGYPIRMFAVFVTLPFHAFLGVTLMNSEHPIAEHYYETVVRNWGPTILEDQQMAGGLLWATGDVVGLVLFLTLMIQWSKASDREASRIDRELDRQEAKALKAQE